MKSYKLHDTTSLCAVCKNGVAAEIWERDGKVFLEKECAEHGKSQVLIASEAEWYHQVMRYPAVENPPALVKKEVHNGCPYDCGACRQHRQKPYLPVIPITSACNMNCVICYTINKNQGAFYMAPEEFARILDVISKNDPHMKIINFTGGEPTLHPQLTRIIRMCHDAGIHRVTISTHGLTFLQNEELLAELAELHARIVLSFHSFDDAVNQKMLGMRVVQNKMKILELLEKYDVDTTLIPVLALGCNEKELGPLVKLLLQKEFLRSLEIHTMTFTGQGGRKFDTTTRITPPAVIRYIEEGSGGTIRMSDFVPSPCAHPLCYQCCYLLQLQEGSFLPFARFMSQDTIRALLTDNLYIEPGEKMETILHQVIMELWAAEIPEETGQLVLNALKALLGKIFSSVPLKYAEQQKISERSSKTIYIHSHMDEDNFDTARIRQCCVAVPSPEGESVPTCSYNILYRGRDVRFSALSLPPLPIYKGGKKA